MNLILCKLQCKRAHFSMPELLGFFTEILLYNALKSGFFLTNLVHSFLCRLQCKRAHSSCLGFSRLSFLHYPSLLSLSLSYSTQLVSATVSGTLLTDETKSTGVGSAVRSGFSFFSPPHFLFLFLFSPSFFYFRGFLSLFIFCFNCCCRRYRSR